LRDFRRDGLYGCARRGRDQLHPEEELRRIIRDAGFVPRSATCCTRQYFLN
jgi:hypothetical protein